MSSSDISIIAKQMESMSMTTTHGVLRRNKRLPPPRYSPYTTGTSFTKEKQKEEAVRLGVELSLFVAEGMFLLSDDSRSMFRFSFGVFRYAGNISCKGPVLGRLFLVIECVFDTYIKPKNGVYKEGGKSIQWDKVFKTSHQHLDFGIRGLDRSVSILENGDIVKPSVFVYCNQELKKLEEKLRSVKDVSEANGFAREAIKSNILHLWKSLFETTPEQINLNTRLHELFRPLVNEINRNLCCEHLASLLI